MIRCDSVHTLVDKFIIIVSLYFKGQRTRRKVHNRLRKRASVLCVFFNVLSKVGRDLVPYIKNKLFINTLWLFSFGNRYTEIFKVLEMIAKDLTEITGLTFEIKFTKTTEKWQ